MKFCIEWCRDQGLLSLEDIKIWRFLVLGFQGFATYPNFKVLGFQGFATIRILRSWVFRVSLHIKILRSWVSRVLRHNTILRSWVSRVSRQKGRARSKIHQGPRPWTQRTQDLEPFWNLGTSLVVTSPPRPHFHPWSRPPVPSPFCLLRVSGPSPVDTKGRNDPSLPGSDPDLGWPTDRGLPSSTPGCRPMANIDAMQTGAAPRIFDYAIVHVLWGGGGLTHTAFKNRKKYILSTKAAVTESKLIHRTRCLSRGYAKRLESDMMEAD